MNIDITNCGNCPMADRLNIPSGRIHPCIISENEMTFYEIDEDQEDAIDEPAPETCPLRTEPITLTLK